VPTVTEDRARGAPRLIETAHLVLREWRDEDLEPMARIDRDPTVTRYLRNPPATPFTRRETEELVTRIRAHWEEHRFGLYAVVEKETEEFIGFIGLAIPAFLPQILPAVEVGWRLDPAFWGRGLATEGARACLPVAFVDLRLHDVVSIGHAENAASIRVMEKLGMRHDRDAVHPAQGWPLRIFRLSRTEWQAGAGGLRG